MTQEWARRGIEILGSEWFIFAAKKLLKWFAIASGVVWNDSPSFDLTLDGSSALLSGSICLKADHRAI